MTSQPRPTTARILPAALAGVVSAALVAALLLAGVVPAVAGGRTLAVDTASTQSDLARGALVVVQPVAPAPGDVIAIAPGPDGVRSLGVVDGVNPAGEPLVSSVDGRMRSIPAAQVEGVYLYGVPWVGGLWSAVGTPSGMFFLAAGLLLLVAGHQLRTARRRGHRADDPGTSAV